MKRLKSLSFISAFIFSSQLWAAPWSQSLPLDTPEQKAEAFLKIRAQIPSMADGAVRYSFDPVTLLENQQKIDRMMEQSPLYHDLHLAHKDLVEFAIYDSASAPAPSAKADLWNSALAKSSQETAHWGLNSEAQLQSEIQKTLNSPLLGKSQGIVVGLAQLLPGPLKKDFFAMSLQAKVLVLKEQLPAEIISHGFAPARLGWTDTAITREEIISRLQEAVAIEQRLTILLTAHFASLQSVSAKAYLAHWNIDANSKKSLEQVFNASVAKMIPTEAVAAEASMVLREVAPVVSMFRGFAGNDCATLCSFPFVNSPNEYTFLVYDAKGGIKGYAQGTKVLAHGRTVLYLHTIAGPRISTQDSLQIMKVLVQEKQNMGWAEILLPPMQKSDAMINFLPVREAFRQVITPVSESIDYVDTSIREAFKKEFQITKTYDDASDNREAFRIDETKLGAALKVVRSEPADLAQVKTAMDRTELIGMIIQMGKELTKNRTMIVTLAPHAGVTAEVALDLISKASNPKRLPIQEFIDSFAASMKEHQFTFKDGYFNKNISLISKGLTKSPDLLANKAFTEILINNLLEQREVKFVSEFLSSKTELLLNKNITTAFFKAYYNDIHETEFQEPIALKAVLNHSPAQVIKNSQLLEMIMISAKGRMALSEFLIANPSWTQALPQNNIGQSILSGKNQMTVKFDKTLKLLLASKNETVFHDILNGELRGLSQDMLTFLKEKLYLASVDHYISLKPTKLGEIFRFLSKTARQDERAFRKILPLVLKDDLWTSVEVSLRVISNVREKSQRPDLIDRAVTDGLSLRPKIQQEVPNLRSLKNFSTINTSRLGIPRCESIFAGSFAFGA